MPDIGSIGSMGNAVSAAIGAAGMAATTVGGVVRTRQQVTDLRKKVDKLELCKDETSDRLARIETKIDFLIGTGR